MEPAPLSTLLKWNTFSPLRRAASCTAAKHSLSSALRWPAGQSAVGWLLASRTQPSRPCDCCRDREADPDVYDDEPAVLQAQAAPSINKSAAAPRAPERDAPRTAGEVPKRGVQVLFCRLAAQWNQPVGSVSFPRIRYYCNASNSARAQLPNCARAWRSDEAWRSTRFSSAP